MPNLKNAKKHNKLAARFKPLYIAAFLQGLIFWYAIEKLFMTSIGLNSEAIAVIIIAFTILTLIVNVPIGIIADRWSRKAILMLASSFMIISCTIAGLSHGFWAYLVAASFSGLFYACYQGVYDSLTYDTLVEETGSADDYERYRGKVQFYDGAALTIGALMSAVITHYLHFRATYFLTIPFAASALIALYYFKEPQEHKKEVSELLGAHVRSTLKAILRKGEVFWIVATLVLISIATKLLLDFDQLWFIAIALPVALYGPFDALLLSSFTSGGFLSAKLTSKRAVALFGLAALVGCFGLFSHYSFLIIVAQTVIVTVMVLYSIVFEGYLHDSLASRVRVGAASVVATIGGILFLPIAYVFGLVSNHYDIFHATWVVVCVVLSVVLTGLKVIARKNSNTGDVSASSTL